MNYLVDENGFEYVDKYECKTCQHCRVYQHKFPCRNCCVINSDSNRLYFQPEESEVK